MDWFRFCLRNGILGPHPKINPIQVLFTRGDVELRPLLRIRQLRGIDRPYGVVAQTMGWAATTAIPPPYSV